MVFALQIVTDYKFQCRHKNTFDQIIEHKRSIFFFKRCAENEVGRLVPNLLLFFNKNDKRKWSTAYFKYISIALNFAYNKNKLYKTLDYWSKDMLNFEFLDKGLGIVFPPYFVYNFSRKMYFY